MCTIAHLAAFLRPVTLEGRSTIKIKSEEETLKPQKEQAAALNRKPLLFVKWVGPWERAAPRSPWAALGLTE